MMKFLPRRTLLRGMGAAVGLPFLDAMVPAFAAPAAGASAKTPCRLMVVYAPTGKIMQYWTPQSTEPGFEFPRILKSLESHRDDIVILSGLAANNGRALGDGAGDHARAASSYLTGAHPRKTEGADIRCGVSMDQLAARSIGANTRFPSLELTCEDSRQAGACDSYSCAYQSIAWKSETQPLAPEMNPRAVFERLFGDAGADNPDRRSILDLTLRDTERLKNGLGPVDRRKLDEYLTSLREVETRIERAGRSAKLPEGVESPTGIPTSFREHARLMFDLATLAFQTDSTRVITFMLAREGGLRTYPEAGVPEAHHSVTHHRNQPELVEKVAKINCFHVEQFAYFVEKLKAAKDGEGSLLDHSLVVYGSPLGDPNVHDHGNLPTLLAGTGKGKVKPGRHVRYKAETPVANLHVALLRLAGAPVERLGDATGPLEQLGG
ncbi:MAG: DUF1552 domain-containing protein [Bryobacteraceae bacterium]|nr:DUF1552 domain-containing protein [Bryobacteraceae bacterium]